MPDYHRAAKVILAEINALDIFVDVKSMEFKKAVEDGIITYIDSAVMESDIAEVKNQSVLFGDQADKNVSVVYSPLNDTGLKPVLRVLEESGYSSITVVEWQRESDGNFPTYPYPNPEIREATELGLRYCEHTSADLLLATDPDADRCGIAVTTTNGDYALFSGNEVGLTPRLYTMSKENIDLIDRVIEYEGFVFKTYKGLSFSYTIKRNKNGVPTGEIVFDRKNKGITRATIELGLKNALEEQEKMGYVSGPKKLGVFGSSYLYPMFIEFGFIKAKSQKSNNLND